MAFSSECHGHSIKALDAGQIGASVAVIVGLLLPADPRRRPGRLSARWTDKHFIAGALMAEHERRARRVREDRLIVS